MNPSMGEYLLHPLPGLLTYRRVAKNSHLFRQSARESIRYQVPGILCFRPVIRLLPRRGVATEQKNFPWPLQNTIASGITGPALQFIQRQAITRLSKKSPRKMP